MARKDGHKNEERWFIFSVRKKEETMVIDICSLLDFFSHLKENAT